MTVVELKKMVIDTALSNLKNELHYIIDRIPSDKAFDQYNAKCEEADRLREALQALQRQALQGAVRGDEWMDEALELTHAALQPKEGDQ